jgi:hypothetical protein
MAQWVIKNTYNLSVLNTFELQLVLFSFVENHFVMHIIREFLEISKIQW